MKLREYLAAGRNVTDNAADRDALGDKLATFDPVTLLSLLDLDQHDG